MAELILDWDGWLAALVILLALGAIGVRQAWQRRSMLVAHAAELGTLEHRLRAAVDQSADRDAQLVQLLDSMPDGVALLDRNNRPVAWNRRFPALAGLARTPRPGQPMTELLPLTWTAARPPQGQELHRNAAGAVVEDVWVELPDGSRLLTCRPRPDSSPAARLGPEMQSIWVRELRDRLPVLLEAAAAGGLAAAGHEAHAMRGLAANLGLTAFADLLLAIERGARDGQLLRLRQAAMGLPTQLDAALEGLAREAA